MMLILFSLGILGIVMASIIFGGYMGGNWNSIQGLKSNGASCIIQI